MSEDGSWGECREGEWVDREGYCISHINLGDYQFVLVEESITHPEECLTRLYTILRLLFVQNV